MYALKIPDPVQQFIFFVPCLAQRYDEVAVNNFDRNIHLCQCVCYPQYSLNMVSQIVSEKLLHSLVTLIPPMSILKWPHACNFHKSVPVFQIKYTTIAFLECNLILNFHKSSFHVRIAVVCVHFCCTCICRNEVLCNRFVIGKNRSW